MHAHRHQTSLHGSGAAKSLPERIKRVLIAGALGVIRALVVIAIGLLIGLAVVQTLLAGLGWYGSGTFSPFPGEAPPPSLVADVVVTNATPAQVAAVRSAVASLRYRLQPRAVAFNVTTTLPCEQCGGDYDAGLNLIQIRADVLGDGPTLRHAVAHEIGHYVDYHFLSDSRRTEFMRLRQIPTGQPWFSGDNVPWQDHPDEDFAEVFALLSLSPGAGPPETSYGPLRNPAAIEQLLSTAGVRFDAASAELDWRAAPGLELAFARDVIANSTLRIELAIAAALYLALGAISAMHDAWRRG